MNASTEHELRSRLEDETSHLTMHIAVHEILACGDRRRRGRRRTLTTFAVATTALAGAAISITLPPGSSPLVAEAAAWGPAMVNLQPGVIDEAGKQCAVSMRSMGWDMPADTTPIAGDSRNGETVAVYRIGEDYGECTFSGSGSRDLQIRGSSQGKWKHLPHGTHIHLLGLSAGQDLPGARTRNGVGTAQVSADTATVRVEVAGQVIDAAVDNRIAAFWSPDGATETEIEEAVLTAYDANGNVLSSTSLG